MAEGEIGNQPHLSSLWHHEQARNDVLHELRESSIRRDGAAVQRPADVPGARTLWRRDARPAVGVARVGAAISGIASVLFTYALQKQTGRILLWAGYAANLAISIAIFAIIAPLISNAVNQSVSGGTYNPAPLAALQGQLTALGYLSVVPALLFGAATYLAWSRVSHGEIPAPPVPPGMPMSTMPPPGGPFPPP